MQTVKPSVDKQRRQRFGLTAQILAGMVLGALIGFLMPEFGISLYFLRDLFLNLIKSVIVPLVFTTVVLGIVGSGSLKSLGRLGVKTLVYFEAVTTAALVVGLVVVNWLKPGSRVSLAANPGEIVAQVGNAHPLSLTQTLVHVFPSSIVDAMARGDVLQIVAFASVFAIATLSLGEIGHPIISIVEALSKVMFRFTGYVMRFAPIGVGAGMAHAIASQGLGVLWHLGKLIGCLYLAIIIMVCAVFCIIMLVAKIPIRQLFLAVREPAAIAFATTSSESALPKAMLAMERFGVPRHIVAFVMPTGYTFNLDGSTLYLAVASSFIAQAAEYSAVFHMSLGQQLVMMASLIVTPKGVAAVPRASLVVLLATVDNFLPPGLGAAGVAVIFGIDEVMDTGRTCVNLVGNCLATAVIARWEGVFDDGVARGRNAQGLSLHP